MSKLLIPEHLRQNLGPEMKMDVHWVDVKLKDGRCLMNVVVRGGAYLTGQEHHQDGEGHLPFQSEDIANIRRRALFGRLWPLWPATR